MKPKSGLAIIIGKHMGGGGDMPPPPMKSGGSTLGDIAKKHMGGGEEDMPEEGMGGPDQDGVDAMQGMIDALHSGDAQSAWEHFKAAAQCADAMPHEEGPHEDEEMGDQPEQ